jgi:FkbM family methyltransferase
LFAEAAARYDAAMFGLGRRKPHKTPEGRLAIVLAAQGIDLFLDVGANIGQTGLALRAGGYAGRIVSFEPIPEAHRALAAAAARDPAWTVGEPVALGAAPGRAILHVAENSDMTSALPATAALLEALPGSRAARTIEVNVETIAQLLPRYAREGDRVFLTIDVQGLDMAVLQGAEPVFDRIAGIQVEMSLLPLYDGEPDYLAILAYLHGHGYRPHIIAERTFSRRLRRQLQIDGVFFRS